MNVYDSERMTDVLASRGYGVTNSPEDADLVILNTCHIREKAAEKVYSELGRIRSLTTKRKDKGLDTHIAVSGCVAQAEGDEIVKRAPFVDIVVGPQSYDRLGELVDGLNHKRALVLTEFPNKPKFENLPDPFRSGPSAFITVQEGCDKFCTFCVVPYTRGPEYSRPVGEIIDEAKRLVALGTREVTLLGQNVNAYHGRTHNDKHETLGGLLYLLAEIPGIDRLRYTTSHPLDMDKDLVAAHRDLPQLMPFLHLPAQSGSDKILKAMNRRHTADDYRKVISSIRQVNPQIAISGDFIVGFPGETDRDFLDTLKLVDDIGYASAYSFIFSPRPGTVAAEKKQVNKKVASDRLVELQALLNQQSRNFNQTCLDKIVDVLFERDGRREGQIVGRSPWMQAVHVDAPRSYIGNIYPVKIINSLPNSLSGCLAV